MKALSKALVVFGGVGLGVAVGALVGATVARRRAAGAVPRTTRGAGTMFVGAVDEVELGAGIARPTPGAQLDAYDPEEVPSEHSEVNELRNKMPFG